MVTSNKMKLNCRKPFLNKLTSHMTYLSTVNDKTGITYHEELINQTKTKDAFDVMIKLRNMCLYYKKEEYKCQILESDSTPFDWCIIHQMNKIIGLKFYTSSLSSKVVTSMYFSTEISTQHRCISYICIVNHMIKDISKKYIRKLFQEMHPCEILIVPIISYLVYRYRLPDCILIFQSLNRTTIISIVVNSKIVEYRKIMHIASTSKKAINEEEIPNFFQSIFDGVYSKRIVDFLNKIFFIGMKLL